MFATCCAPPATPSMIGTTSPMPAGYVLRPTAMHVVSVSHETAYRPAPAAAIVCAVPATPLTIGTTTPPVGAAAAPTATQSWAPVQAMPSSGPAPATVLAVCGTPLRISATTPELPLSPTAQQIVDVGHETPNIALEPGTACAVSPAARAPPDSSPHTISSAEARIAARPDTRGLTEPFTARRS